IPQRPHPGMAPKKTDATVARLDSTETTDRRPEMATLPVAPPSPAPAPSAGPGVEPSPDTKVARVTIEGCLERADDTFRLTDTAGTKAPAPGSGERGFPKKRAAPRRRESRFPQDGPRRDESARFGEARQPRQPCGAAGQRHWHAGRSTDPRRFAAAHLLVLQYLQFEGQNLRLEHSRASRLQRRPACVPAVAISALLQRSG